MTLVWSESHNTSPLHCSFPLPLSHHLTCQILGHQAVNKGRETDSGPPCIRYQIKVGIIPKMNFSVVFDHQKLAFGDRKKAFFVLRNTCTCPYFVIVLSYSK